MRRLIEGLIPFLVFVVPFGVYLYTLSPAIAPGDSTEMVTAAIILGVPHQPSYPINTILGYIGSKLPLPLNRVERVNMVSAFLQAITAVVFYFLALELFKIVLFENKRNKLKFGKNLSPEEDSAGIPAYCRFIAFSGSMFLAFSTIYWQYATKFEVFPLNNLFAVLLLLLGIKIYQKQKKPLEFLLAFMAGLAFVHHQTIILIFPAIAFLLWRQLKPIIKDEMKIAILAICVFLGTLPFFSILYIASRNPFLNWGNINNLDGVLAALTRRDFGTFSSFLVGFEPLVPTEPIRQVYFYLKYFFTDYSWLGILAVILGFWYLWKHSKHILSFISIGYFVSGILFLTYANFPINDSFNQATVRRFHMIPNIFIALFIIFGLYFLYKNIDSIMVKKTEYKLGIAFGKLCIIFSFLFVIIANFSKANNRNNDLTLQYVRQAYASTPNNALILLSGDIPNMTVEYYRYVELKGKDHRITFSPGQFHLSWFIPQLKKRHPELIIPLPMSGKLFTTATQVIEANYGKWPIYVGPDLVVHDPDIEKKYTLWPENLLFLVKKKGESLKLEDYIEKNNAFWDKVPLDELHSLRKRSPLFEETLIFHYERHFFNLGYVFEEVKKYDDAAREYKRALEIDPYFKESLAALGRIYGYKMIPPKYDEAVDNLQKYISVLKENEGDLAAAAQNMIYELEEKAYKDMVEQGKKDKKIGSVSAQMKEGLDMSSASAKTKIGSPGAR